MEINCYVEKYLHDELANRQRSNGKEILNTLCNRDAGFGWIRAVIDARVHDVVAMLHVISWNSDRLYRSTIFTLSPFSLHSPRDMCIE